MRELARGGETSITIDDERLAKFAGVRKYKYGEMDTEVRRRAGLALCATLAGADHVLVRHAAHLPNLDAPHAYNQIMIEFARRHLPAAA